MRFGSFASAVASGKIARISFSKLRVQAVDVVIAVVGKQQAAALDVARQVVALVLG